MMRSAVFGALAALIAVPALAQGGAKPATVGVSAKGAAAKVSQSSAPTFGEGTVARIAAAMLSYTALEVQGGWPTIPAGARFSPGANGPDVVLLRRRLAITEDLAADQAEGDVYDDVLAAALRRFQAR